MHRSAKYPARAVLCTMAVIGMTSLAHANCGDQVRVAEGDTLSSIAARCDVTEAKILDLNPNIGGSKDLRAGMTLDLASPTASEAASRAREAARSTFGRIKSYAKEAGETLEGAAEKVTSSVKDFLARNPDLHQSVRKLGQRLNIPGMEKLEPLVSLSVAKGAPGTPVTLSAIGLPPAQRVTIAGGIPEGDYEILDSARTTADGTLQVTVEVPQWADPQRDFIFVVALPEHNIAARSEQFDVIETTGGAAPPK